MTKRVLSMIFHDVGKEILQSRNIEKPRPGFVRLVWVDLQLYVKPKRFNIERSGYFSLDELSQMYILPHENSLAPDTVVVVYNNNGDYVIYRNT